MLMVGVMWLPVSIVQAQSSSSSAQTEESEEEDEDEVDEDELKEIQGRIDELTKKLEAVRSERDSLASNVQYLDSKIQLNEQQIAKTRYEIRALEAQINDLDQRISGLQVSIGELSAQLIDRVQTQYKQGSTDAISMMFATTGLSDFFKQDKYIERVRAHTQELLLTTELKRQVYDDERTHKEAKQDEMKVLQSRIEAQQKDLREQQEAKRRLLEQTKNSEANYSRLLSEAQAELTSLNRFTSGKATSLLSPQNSPDGWYFSQRDERWGKNCVGTACDYNIFEVGCLVASTAMVKKKFGENVTPATIAANSSYFFGRTAYMLRPYPTPSGYRYNFSRYNASTIDRELEAGRPVIAKLRVATQYSTHFVVIKGGSKGNYVMHDPWEGYDKKFNDYYSTGQIIEMAYLVKN